MRGGTSKGAYFLAEDLPADPASRDILLLAIMGSPDARQIDGIGGAHPLTSKVAVVGPSADPGVDVDYLFLQVMVDQPIVTDKQNCGNILAGVGPFAVERGAAYGIVGESGSGKTTVLRTLAGLVRDWRGAVEIAGEALSPRRPRFLPRTLQMVFQDPAGALHPRHTVERALCEPLYANGIGDAKGRMERALHEVGLDARFRYRYPHELSGGQRQRVAIARALMSRPKLLLLDEPSLGLAPLVVQAIFETITRLKEEGTTILLVEQNARLALDVADRAYVMESGRIILEGAAEELEHNPQIENTYLGT